MVFAISADGEMLWCRPAPVASLTHPVVDEDENIYLFGSDGLLYSFCSTGGLNWAQPTPRRDGSIYVCYHNEIVYVLVGGDVTAFNTDGSEAWDSSVHVGECFVSAPAIGSDGILYTITKSVFQESKPYLTALGENGEVKWSVQLHYFIQTAPIITIDGDVAVGTTDGGLLYLIPGRGDISPPYLAETFPPQGTVIPIDDFNLSMVMLDPGVGIRPDSIWLSVNNQEVEVDRHEVIGGYALYASPRQILSPFQNVMIEVYGEDRRFSKGTRPFHLTAIEFHNTPKVVMAGYGMTTVSSEHGGDLYIYALIDPLSEISKVELSVPDSAFLLQLSDEGRSIDEKLDGRWYSASYCVQPGMLKGRYLLEIAAENTDGRRSLPWPYLTVETEEPVSPRQGASGKVSPSPKSAAASKSSGSGSHAPMLHSLALAGKGGQGNEMHRPRILAAGYSYTHLTVQGGVIRFQAWVEDYDGIDNIDRVEVYAEGNPIGLRLYNNGQGGDDDALDSIYTFQAFMGSDILAAGPRLFELKAFDKQSNESDLWPYLEIK